MEAIDKVRDTSTSHERCSIIEVMGRHAGYIALWCGIANGAEDILLPERYDGNEQLIINRIIENKKRGKKHHIIINAEGIGHSTSMAARIEAATGLVCVDKQQQALRPSIIWCDSRAVPYGERAFNDLGKEHCLQHLLNSPGNFTAAMPLMGRKTE